MHLGVWSLVALMFNLGFWQLHRLDDKKAFNATVVSRSLEPVAPIDDVLLPDTEPRNVEWRRVKVSGTYEPSLAVTIVNRSQDGTAGVDSLVPLRLADGRVLLVSRGFIPLAMAVPLPRTDPVEVVGYLRPTQVRAALGAVDSSDPNAVEFQRFDVERIAKKIDGAVVPMWLHLIEESPAPQSQWPARVPLPEITEGPHLSYAVQWFFFSLVAIVAWIVVVRKRIAEPAAPNDATA